MLSREIVVFGSINRDFFSYVEKFPRPGESVRGSNFIILNGGKGANQAVTASRLGGSVRMIGMIGNDLFADGVLEDLKQSGVNVELIQKVDGIITGCGIITVDAKGENNIVIIPGANDKLTPQRARELEQQISQAALLMCQSEAPQDASLEAFKIAKKHGVTTFINLAPCYPDMNTDILSFADILCVNETEAEAVVKKPLLTDEELKQAACEMLKLGPNLVIVTLGKRGALLACLQDGNVKVDRVEAPKVKAVDTTGAGDCFCGSFAYFLVNHFKLSYAEMVERAVKIASISVCKHGCQSSYPYKDDVKEPGIFN